jgi:hypothetical protein
MKEFTETASFKVSQLVTLLGGFQQGPKIE